MKIRPEKKFRPVRDLNGICVCVGEFDSLEF